MMELLIASGAPREKVDSFLLADLDGAGAVRDRIAVEMTNDLLRALGQSGRQTVGEVERLRRRGRWQVLDRRPPE